MLRVIKTHKRSCTVAVRAEKENRCQMELSVSLRRGVVWSVTRTSNHRLVQTTIILNLVLMYSFYSWGIGIQIKKNGHWERNI